jgi:hypothetical protein
VAAKVDTATKVKHTIIAPAARHRLRRAGAGTKACVSLLQRLSSEAGALQDLSQAGERLCSNPPEAMDLGASLMGWGRACCLALAGGWVLFARWLHPPLVEDSICVAYSMDRIQTGPLQSASGYLPWSLLSASASNGDCRRQLIRRNEEIMFQQKSGEKCQLHPIVSFLPKGLLCIALQVAAHHHV